MLNNNVNNNNNKHHQKISIVISGWPAVGKTTMAAELAKEFDFKMYNGGDILKSLAGKKGYSISGKDWWDTEEAKKFMVERSLNPCIDKEMDQKLVELANKGNAIITSYTLPWLVHHPIKIWLKGSQDSRAKRMSNRDNISLPEAKRIIKLRDEENRKIYSKLYGFNFGEDLTVFDFVLNTDIMILNSLISISKNIVRQLLLVKNY